MIEDRAALLALRARIDERFIAPFKRNTFANRTWFLVAVAFVCAVHAGVLGFFLYRDWTRPPDVAKEQETPVEVVVQPPPPQQQQQAQKQQQEIEKPATSAPRAENDSKIDTNKADNETRAPKAATPPTDGDPQPSKDVAQTTKDANDDADAEAAAANPDLQKDAEALDKAAPKPAKPTPVKPKTAARPKRTRTAMNQLAGLTDTPDYHFAKHTKKSPVSGGDEDSRYLAIVYGLISSHIRLGGESSVTVTFELDDNGDVLDIGLLQSSGDQMADAEVINAVRRSSPFPPPPPDRPHSLRATIDVARSPLSVGER